MVSLEIPFLEEFGKAFLPKWFRPKIRAFLARAGVFSSPYKVVGELFYVSLLITAGLEFIVVYPLLVTLLDGFSLNSRFASLLIGLLIFLTWSLIQLGLMGFFFLIGYFFLDLKVYKRTHQIEESLPDFLVLVSTNLKGGMSLESALWNAIKPKFGVLSHEVTLVSKKVMTGYEVAEALAELAEKYPSPELKRTLGLIISEFEIGGKVTDIIDDIVDNLKNTQKLKKELVASVISYVIFISVIVLFIAPVLFALSYNLIQFISGFIEKVGGTLSSSDVPGFLTTMSTEGIDPEKFKIFGYFATGTIALISSIIVSIIEKGDIRGGIKYLPIFLVVSLVIYYLALLILTSALGGIQL